MSIVSNNTTQGLTITSAAHGAIYGGDYEVDFVDRSLVTKKYVDDSSGAIQASNGLTRTGDVITLGGAITNDVELCGKDGDGDFRLEMSGTTQNSIVCVTAGSIGLDIGNNFCYSTMFMGGNSIVISANATGCDTLLRLYPDKFELCADGDANLMICDESTVKNGLQYSTCISTGFASDCSLVDKGYVDGSSSTVQGNLDTVDGKVDTNTSAISVAISGVTNGLTKVGSTSAKLGGTLTEDTTINGASTYDLNLTSLAVLNIGAATVNVTGVVTLQTTPNAGSATGDSILVWNSTDKQIKKVNASELGEDNNRYDILAVSNSVVNLDGTEYVVLVDTNSAAVTVNLPASPVIGTAVKIKDKGNALTNNIIVDAGAGKLIDNSQLATINTDFGALELVYGETNTWYSLAFIN